MQIKGLPFWGYIDKKGVVQIFRYAGMRAIKVAEKMPFVAEIIEPFEAFDEKHAREKVMSALQERPRSN